MNQLPKLKKIGEVAPKRNKKKVLLISDDIKFFSGIATVARELVVGTVDTFDWCQLAAALQHPDHGKRVDLSADIAKETGVSDAYCIQYCHTGYGNPQVIREIVSYEKPDLILLITDPRFFGHVWNMEHEIHNKLRIPIAYLNIWDNLVYPFWNASAYASCDLLMSINRQTEVINKKVLEYHQMFSPERMNLLSYVPHGSSIKFFYPITDQSPDYEPFSKFRDDFRKKHDADFVILFNSRNIRRKSPGDIILAYRRFCDGLPREQAKKCLLVMKTAVADENGTDLLAVKRTICPRYKVIFIPEALGTQQMNWLYNVSDCVFFMSSAEGFGLAANEGIMCGKMLVAPVTGGLQDQMRFEDDNGDWVTIDENFTTNHRGTYTKCGEWAMPIFPAGRSLNGSIATPYIFDDWTDAEDAAVALRKVHDLGKDERERRGMVGREWVLSGESGMSSVKMCERFTSSINALLETWTPPVNKWELVKVVDRPVLDNIGLMWREN